MDKNNRWLELYGLRYAIGSIIGCGIIQIFYSKLNSAPYSFSLIMSDTSAAIALGAAGFGYCYISSAPILVLHVARCILIRRLRERMPISVVRSRAITLRAKLSNIRKMDACRQKRIKAIASRRRSRWIKSVTSFAINTASLFTYLFPVMVIIFFLIMPYDTRILLDCIELPIYSFLTIITVSQSLALIAIFRHRRELKLWYQRLSEARSFYDKGIVESYRDMREHANAYFIITLELVLALAINAIMDSISSMEHLDSTQKCIFLFKMTGMLSILWISPSALIWFAASQIEIDFVHPLKTRTGKIE